MANTENTKAFYGAAIPSDWEVVPLEKVVLKPIVYGIVQAGPEIENGVHYIKSTDVGGEIIVNKLSKTSKEIAAKYNRSEVFPGDIVFSLRGNIGELSIVPEELPVANLTQGTARISVDKSRFSSNFIKYVLHSTTVFKNIIQVSKGSTFSEISLGELRNIELPIPPLSEQRAIAQVLSQMDRAINTHNQLIAQKELRKKWLMQELLTGKKRLKGFEGVWKEATLGKLFDRVTRKNSEVNTNVVTISAQRGFVKQTDFFNKSIASEVLDNYFLVRKGEFCYNKSYSNGYPWGATKRLNDFEKAVVTTLYICFGIKDDSMTNGNFFEQYFEANFLDRGLTKIAHEGGRAHGLLNVTPSDFFSLKITIPSFDEQTAISQVLQTADKEIQLLKAKRERLKEQKKGMMQVLLTGKKRLKI
jgi:type I restriction enzyme S subunit